MRNIFNSLKDYGILFLQWLDTWSQTKPEPSELDLEPTKAIGQLDNDYIGV